VGVLERLDTILVTDLTDDTGDRYPPPSAESMAAAKQVKMRSVIAAPLPSTVTARGRSVGQARDWETARTTPIVILAASAVRERTARLGWVGAGGQDRDCGHEAIERIIPSTAVANASGRPFSACGLALAACRAMLPAAFFLVRDVGLHGGRRGLR